MDTQAQMPVTTKLKNVLYRISELSKKAEEGMFCADRAKVSRALVAIGLCRQALEQVNAACQNLGFTIKSLPAIPDGPGDDAARYESVQRELKEARMDVVRVITQNFGVSREAVFMSMNGFAEECAVMAALMAGRAEQYLAS